MPAFALTPARLWHLYPRESVAVGVLVATVAALSGAAMSMQSNEEAGSLPAATVPAPPPLLVRALAPTDALAVNRQIPLDNGPNPSARPFFISASGGAAQARAVECLTSAVYYEAGSEDSDGQRAVAQVVLNRVRHPAFPASVCGVVYEGSTRATGCQFTFTCDGSLARRPEPAGWERARAVASAAINGAVYATVGNATHYHANYVVPYWASTLAKNAVVGAHIFYRWAGGWGRPGSFVQPYAGAEPDAAALKSAAMMVKRTAPATAVSAEMAEAIEKIPGAVALPTVLNKRGETRVAIRMHLAAREAVEKAEHRPYVESVQASDNLRYALGNGATATAAEEKPLGRAVATGDTASGAN